MEKKKCIAEVSDIDKRLDVFLKEKEEELSRTRIKELIKKGLVSVNGAVVKPHYCLKTGDSLQWEIPDNDETGLQAQEIPLNIIFEDEDIIVIDKPSGIVVHPGAGNEKDTLVNALLFHTKDLSSVNPARPGIVHRLDKGTSGVMVVAKNNKTHFGLAKQFKKHSIERRYVALVSGAVEFDEGVVDLPIKRHSMDRKKMAVSFSQDAKEAYTFYRVLKRFQDFTAVELFPKTGRTHQLRVHLFHIGHPVLGDLAYGRKDNFPRLALHAMNLGFTHPATKEFLRFESPLPEEMKAVMRGVKI